MANGLANSFVQILRNLFCVWATEPQRSKAKSDRGREEEKERGECGSASARTRNEVDRRVCCPRGYGLGPHCCRLWFDQGWRAIFICLCIICLCVCGNPGWQCKLIARLPQFVAASVSLAFSTLRSQMTLTLTLIAAAGDATNATDRSKIEERKIFRSKVFDILPFPPLTHPCRRGNTNARGHLHVPVAICCCCS